MKERHDSQPRIASRRARSEPCVAPHVPSAIRLALLSLVALLPLLALSCANGDGASSSRGTLRVGVAPNYPPVVFEHDGRVVGIEADLAHLMGRALGREIVFQSYAFPELLDALERGEVDVVMSGLSITPERAERVLFCEPYMQVGQLAVIRSSDIARFGRIQSIRRYGTRVGYASGTTGEEYVAENLAGAKSFAFDTVEDGIRSLRAGRIDYFIHDAPTIWLLAGDPANRDLQGLYQPLTRESLAWAVRKGNTQLQMLLNATLAHEKREGSVEPIIDRWIPVRVTVR